MSPTANTSELDRLNREIVVKPAGLLVTGLYFGCFVLDIIWLLGVDNFPSSLASFACASRPIGIISSALFAQELVQYTARHCLDATPEPLDPLVSVIFLSIKYALAMLMVLVCCCSVIVRPRGLLLLATALSEYGEDRANYYYKERMRWLKRILVALALCIPSIYLNSGSGVADFNTSLAHKLFLEDGVALVLPGTIFVVLVFFVLFSTVRSGRRTRT